jgi:hypothetical protein
VYTLPMPMEIEGTFVLNLKFSEVYFEQPGKKVFGLQMNGLEVIRQLDIYERVGFGAAYDEHIEFKIDKASKTLSVGRETAPYDGQLVLNFMAQIDNPKVNALLVAQGTLADFRRHHQPKKRRKKKEDNGGLELTLGEYPVVALCTLSISSCRVAEAWPRAAAVCLVACFLAPWAYTKYKAVHKAYTRSKKYS